MLNLARFVAREAANVRLVNNRFADAPPQVAVSFPIEKVIDDDTLRGPDDAVGRRQEIARQRLGVGIDQPGAAVEPLAALGIVRAIGLKMIELPRADARNKNAPDVPPAIGLGAELDDLFRLGVVGLLIEQQPHFLGAAAINDELDAIFMND